MSGKRDRPAHFNDNDDEKDNLATQKTQENEKDSEKEIAERKYFNVDHRIYKIKSATKEVSESKSNFTLFPKQEDNPNQADTSKKQDIVESAKGEEKPKDEKSHENGNNKEEKKQASSLTGTSQGLFGNGVGIFTNSGSGLFSGSLFGKSSTLPQSSQPTSNIFGNSQSIFNFSGAGVPPVKKDSQGFPGFGSTGAQGEEDDGDSAELEKDQNVQIDKTKSTGNYEYTNNCSILFQEKASKVKKNNGEPVEGIQVLVSQDSEKQNSWMTVRLLATKNAIITGLIIKGKSEVKHFGKKDENVVISLLVLEGKKQEKQIVKVQFETGEAGKKLVETIEGLAK